MDATAKPHSKRPSEQLSRWLALHEQLGAQRLIALVEQFGSTEAIFTTPINQLQPLLTSKEIEVLGSDVPSGSVAASLEWLEEPDRYLFTWLDQAYPSQLRQIPDPPAVLFVHGDPTALSRPQLAIVGSRNPSQGGAANAETFAGYLAQAGLVITSGLALGVDGAAHRGTLAAGGQTVAVAGNGLDRVYPRSHHGLAHEIAARGALVSEYPIGTPPRREHFPQRNRLISGLSLGVLVVEAAIKSGSLITARLAGEQGREVFAIPGSIHSPLSHGCHALIRQGAKLVETGADVLEELPGSWREQSEETKRAKTPLNNVDEETSKLLACLGYDPVDVDTLVDRSGLTTHTISSMLLVMELRGLIEARPGGKYLRTSRKV